MSEEELERLRSLDWNDLGLRLLVFAKYWAKNHYFWTEGRPLAEGKSPDEIAREAISAFWGSVRKWNPKYDVLTQLKGAVRSILWNLHQKKSSKLTAPQPPEFFDLYVGEVPDAATEAASQDYCRAMFEALYKDDAVRNSDELMLIVMAYEEGAETIADVAEKTGIEAARIYALRRQLKDIKQRVLGTLDTKDGNEKEL
jgi:hypothetical protein